MNTEGKRGREHPSWKARVAPWLPSLGLVYWITAIGYVLYSDVTDTGLMGHLFAFEVHTLGFANDVLNLLLVMFAVSFGPPMLLVGAVGRWQRPDATPPAKSLKAKIVHPGVLQRLPVFKPILALLVIGLAGAFIHARNLQVYDMDLGAFPIPLAPRAGFLVLKAIPASQFRSGYFSTYPKGGVRVNTYQPLVGPGWAPDQPIHYFLYETSHDLSFAADWRGRTPAMEVPAAVPYDAAQIAPEFDASHLQAVHGKIVGRLPTIVAQDYDAKGFVVAPDYIVIAPIRMQGHEVAFFDRYENFLVPALLIVGLPVALFVGGVHAPSRFAPAIDRLDPAQCAVRSECWAVHRAPDCSSVATRHLARKNCRDASNRDTGVVAVRSRAIHAAVTGRSVRPVRPGRPDTPKLTPTNSDTENCRE